MEIFSAIYGFKGLIVCCIIECGETETDAYANYIANLRYLSRLKVLIILQNTFMLCSVNMTS